MDPRNMMMGPRDRLSPMGMPDPRDRMPDPRDRLGSRGRDRYEDDREPLFTRGGARAAAAVAGRGAVLVTNLHSCVSGEDMEELFCTIGKIASARKIREGVAEVVFLNEDDAYRSIEMFNNRPLDGQPMYVELMPESSGSAGGSFGPRSYGMAPRDRLGGAGGGISARDRLGGAGSSMSARDRLGGGGGGGSMAGGRWGY